MQTSVPTEGRSAVYAGSLHLQNNVIRSSSVIELRDLARLVYFCQRPSALETACLHKLSRSLSFFRYRNEQSTWKRHHDGVLAGTVVLEVFEDERYAALLTSGVSYQWYFEPNNRGRLRIIVKAGVTLWLRKSHWACGAVIGATESDCASIQPCWRTRAFTGVATANPVPTNVQASVQL